MVWTKKKEEKGKEGTTECKKNRREKEYVQKINK